MTWQNSYGMPYLWGMEPRPPLDSLPFNEQCFIRKGHKCGKLFGASKSCFIACPTDDDLEPILELMSEKLSKVGIEPIIAVKERAYGQDIFCTKICGKVIESRFCIVILDDTIDDGKRIPNPNVYYEYGLMTSLRKHIIPLQKENLELAFNIQSYDTIKYTNKNIATELDRAIKDASRITEAKEQEVKKTSLSEKTLLRKLELAGLELRDNSDWVLNEAIGDTNFKGFGQYDKTFCAYIGKIDDDSEFQDYLDDLGVVLYRTEKKIEAIEAKLKKFKKTKLRIENSMGLTGSARMYSGPSRLSQQERQLAGIESEIKNAEDKTSLMTTIFIGFIIQPGINAKAFISDVEALLDQYTRYKLCCSVGDAISFGDIEVSWAESAY
jgi:hypothetical protein